MVFFSFLDSLVLVEGMVGDEGFEKCAVDVVETPDSAVDQDADA